jgi:DNA invertase Pin-like site-specific DNA recombinase
MAPTTVRPRFDKGVLLYLRVSSDKQSDERQQITVPRYAAQNFPDAPTREIRELGVSAFRTSIFDRAGGRELIGLIKSGEYCALVVDSQDRLSRGRQSEWWTFFDLCSEYGVKVHTVKDGAISDDEAGELIASLRQSIARRESAEKSHRSKTAARARAEGGYWIRGTPPAGCETAPAPDGSGHRILIPGPDFERIARAHERVSDGYSINATANELGLKPTTLTGRILGNRHYIGEVRHDGEWLPAKWEPMLDLAVFARVEERKKINRHERGGKPVHHPFGPLLRCHCGARLVHKLGRGVYLYYCCQNSCGIRIAAENLESALIACLSMIPACIEQLLEGDLSRYVEHNTGEAKEKEQALAAKQTELGEYLRMAAKPGAAGAAAEAEADRLGAEIDQLAAETRALSRDAATMRADLERLRSALSFGGEKYGLDSAIITWWATASVEEKRTTFSEIFKQIQFTPSAFELAFRHGLPLPMAIRFDDHKRTDASAPLRELGFGKSNALRS